jgi:dTDP-4-amino-4,6-dideoxygalactose transaminase
MRTRDIGVCVSGPAAFAASFRVWRAPGCTSSEGPRHLNDEQGDLSMAERAATGARSLPLLPELTPDGTDRAVSVIRELVS